MEYVVSDELSISMRPRTFDSMVGAKKLVRQIRKIVSSDKVPKAWMFSGETGSGKTTIARIMAVAFQCTHHKDFGNTCTHCRRHSNEFDITEINCAKYTGKVEMEDAISGYDYAPKPGSLQRVYILDEAHKSSDSSQNALLKPTEDCPRTTKFIICTTRADKIIPTLQSRCTIFAIPGLDLDGIKELIRRALKKFNSDRDSGELAEKLLEKGITSPRLVLKAVQKYVDSETTADEAAEVTLVSDVDSYALCRSLIKGDWEAVAQIMMKAKNDDNVVIRASVAGYLNAILLGDTESNHRADVVAKAILQLNAIRDDFPAMSAVLYNVCKYFKKEKR